MVDETAFSEIERALATQILVAWAGEGRSEPKRLGWWDTDLVDDAGGGDLIARLAPRTHVWASLELVREAARRTDARARAKHGEPDKLRTLFFLGFETDEAVSDRLRELKREGRAPEEALPLPFKLGSKFDREKFFQAISQGEKVSFETVAPIGRRLKGSPPSAPDALVKKLAAALIPVANDYPLPFFALER
jgi:hypothetical protein